MKYFKTYEAYRRGVSVDEGTLYGNEVAIYMGEDGETRIEKRGRGYYGYNDEFDFTAKNKKELEQKLSGWGYYLIAGSLDEAVELVHVYKDGKLYDRVNEARNKKVTKQMWRKMSDEKRFDALLSVVKDPDDAEKYVEFDWNDLPSGFERDMTLYEKN